ncbi:hypothetical protein D3C80_1250990 [compost metagenome]
MGMRNRFEGVNPRRGAVPSQRQGIPAAVGADVQNHPVFRGDGFEELGLQCFIGTEVHQGAGHQVLVLGVEKQLDLLRAGTHEDAFRQDTQRLHVGTGEELGVLEQAGVPYVDGLDVILLGRFPGLVGRTDVVKRVHRHYRAPVARLRILPRQSCCWISVSRISAA